MMDGLYSMAEVNRLLFSLLGSNDLVKQWWNSPNKHWDGKTPLEIWSTGNNGNKEVWSYVSFHGYR
jgi:hypothetical protein